LSCECKQSSHVRDETDRWKVEQSVDKPISNLACCHYEDLPQCDVKLKESLPSGAFVDLYQAEEARNYGGPKVYSASDIDLEKPEYESLPHNLSVYFSMISSSSSSSSLTSSEQQSITLHANLSLSLHARYHRPMYGQQFAQVVIHPPRVFIHCESANEKRRSEVTGHITSCALSDWTSCSWREIACRHTGSTENAMVTFQIPVGRMEHFTLVIVGTFAVTIIATLCLVRTLIINAVYVKS